MPDSTQPLLNEHSPSSPGPEFNTPLVEQAHAKLTELADRLTSEEPNWWVTFDDIHLLARVITGNDALYELVVSYLPEISDGTRAEYATQIRKAAVR